MVEKRENVSFGLYDQVEIGTDDILECDGNVSSWNFMGFIELNITFSDIYQNTKLSI